MRVLAKGAREVLAAWLAGSSLTPFFNHSCARVEGNAYGSGDGTESRRDGPQPREGAQIHQSMMNNPQNRASHRPRETNQKYLDQSQLEGREQQVPLIAKKKKGGLQPIIVRHTECSSGTEPLLPLSLALECALSLPTVEILFGVLLILDGGTPRRVRLPERGPRSKPRLPSCVRARAGLPGEPLGKMAAWLLAGASLGLSGPSRGHTRPRAIQ